jgi:hypothetical protein
MVVVVVQHCHARQFSYYVHWSSTHLLAHRCYFLLAHKITEPISSWRLSLTTEFRKLSTICILGFLPVLQNCSRLPIQLHLARHQGSSEIRALLRYATAICSREYMHTYIHERDHRSKNKNVKACCNADFVVHDPVVFKPNIMLKITASRSCKPVQRPE